MRISYATIIPLLSLGLSGCMHSQANRQQGGTSPEFGSSTARATSPPAATELLNQVERADKLIGEDVLSSDHLTTGKIDDFVVDQDSGQILYGIVGIGGVLGVGETKVAVPPGLFIEAKKGSVQVNVDKHKLTRAPQIPTSEKVPTANFVNNVYGYYGQKVTWEGPVYSTAAAFNSARKVSELTGMTIQNSAHQDLGKVQTIVLNVPAGREEYVVLSPSSDMNLGNNYYALPPKALKFSPDQKTLVTDITREKLGNAPHFAKDDWSELSNTAWAQKVYEYYGQPASASGAALQPTGRLNQNGPAYVK